MRKILIDGDVLLYMALATAHEDTLESACARYTGILKDVTEIHFADPKDVELYLSTDGANFRKNQYEVYKSNRKTRAVLEHLPGLKDWVFNTLQGIHSPNGEADDYLLIRAADLDAQGNPWIIATVDKDLRTYPGSFYNLRTRDWLTVSEEDAFTFMIQQFVMGDSVDGIKGLKLWGPKKTEALINNYHSWESNYDKAKEIWRDQYGKGWEAPFNETCNLAFIRRRAVDLKPLDFARMSHDAVRALLRIPLQGHP